MAIKLVVKRSNAGAATPLHEEWWPSGSFYSIGSGANANLRLNGAGVASEQAVIMEEYGRPVLMSTAEGTEFNGESLGNQARREITHGAQLRLGGYVVSFLLSPDDAPDDATGPLASTPFRRDEGLHSATTPLTPTPTPPPTPLFSKTTQNGVKEFLANMHNEDFVHKYYFFIQGGARDGERILLNTATVMLGWDESGQNISSEPSAAGARAVVQYNVATFEVTVNPQSAGMVAVNNELIEQTRTLVEGDEIRLAPTAITEPSNMSVLVFHEPPLVDLFPAHHEKRTDALPTTTLALDPRDAGTQALTPRAPVLPEKAGLFSSERKLFGYFTTLNIIMFVLVILLTSVLTFFLLENL
ncbi:MAG TPA: FHA domain-containing protein [Pyrinomonadaceae bacterium]|jgi:hypothetical protein|nr:FHA domain-containing protein [Pyrinomonadaceae bacterium]